MSHCGFQHPRAGPGLRVGARCHRAGCPAICACFGPAASGCSRRPARQLIPRGAQTAGRSVLPCALGSHRRGQDTVLPAEAAKRTGQGAVVSGKRELRPALLACARSARAVQLRRDPLTLRGLRWCLTRGWPRGHCGRASSFTDPRVRLRRGAAASVNNGAAQEWASSTLLPRCCSTSRSATSAASTCHRCSGIPRPAVPRRPACALCQSAGEACRLSSSGPTWCARAASAPDRPKPEP
jgi:hypothetical protein